MSTNGNAAAAAGSNETADEAALEHQPAAAGPSFVDDPAAAVTPGPDDVLGRRPPGELHERLLKRCIGVKQPPVVKSGAANAYEVLTELRMAGTPVILEGAEGWAGFAKRWFKAPDEGNASGEKFDPEALIRDLGNEEVPLVRPGYDEKAPITDNMQLKEFLAKAWSGNDKGLYCHQWQFPLTPSGCAVLCGPGAHVPSPALGDDLLGHWLDGAVGNPLQYLFLGAAGTYSKLHQDKGGMAICIGTLVGEKECILVHRDDAELLGYGGSVNVYDADLDMHPLFAFARVWRCVLRPGQVLVLPQGTFHACRNETRCLSYSRLHLDEVNLPSLFVSLMLNDALEIDHATVIWNSARALVSQIDAETDRARATASDGGAKLPLSKTLQRRLSSLTALRHIVRALSRAPPKHRNPTGKSVRRERSRGRKAAASSGSGGGSSGGAAAAPRNDWERLTHDVDMCLHEFLHRFKAKPPPCPALPVYEAQPAAHKVPARKRLPVNAQAAEQEMDAEEQEEKGAGEEADNKEELATAGASRDSAAAAAAPSSKRPGRAAKDRAAAIAVASRADSADSTAAAVAAKSSGPRKEKLAAAPAVRKSTGGSAAAKRARRPDREEDEAAAKRHRSSASTSKQALAAADAASPVARKRSLGRAPAVKSAAETAAKPEDKPAAPKLTPGKAAKITGSAGKGSPASKGAAVAAASSLGKAAAAKASKKTGALAAAAAESPKTRAGSSKAAQPEVGSKLKVKLFGKAVDVTVLDVAPNVTAVVLKYLGTGMTWANELHPVGSLLSENDKQLTPSTDLKIGVKVKVLWGRNKEPFFAEVVSKYQGAVIRVHNSRNGPDWDQWISPEDIC